VSETGPNHSTGSAHVGAVLFCRFSLGNTPCTRGERHFHSDSTVGQGGKRGENTAISMERTEIQGAGMNGLPPQASKKRGLCNIQRCDPSVKNKEGGEDGKRAICPLRPGYWHRQGHKDASIIRVVRQPEKQGREKGELLLYRARHYPNFLRNAGGGN